MIKANDIRRGSVAVINVRKLILQNVCKRVFCKTNKKTSSLESRPLARMHNLDLNPVTLILDLDLDVLLPKMKFVGQGFQTFKPEQDRQTHRQTRLKLSPHRIRRW